jgi:cobalt-precorrin-7 (C5)-methyltransferase
MHNDNSEFVYAVGIGPGDLAFLTPRGERAIREASVVVGFETVIDFIRKRTETDLLACGYDDESETLRAFAKRVAAGESGTAVLMGDPNFSGYQFVRKVEAAVDCSVRIVPGISSLQIAASRARTPMEETVFVTLHKSGSIDSELDRIQDAVGDYHVLVLPRPFDWMPGDIAAYLLESDTEPALDTFVLERLTHDDEKRTRTTLGELAADADGSGRNETPFSDLSVLVVRKG